MHCRKWRLRHHNCQSIPEVALTDIEVSIQLSSFNGSRRGVSNALRDMLGSCPPVSKRNRLAAMAHLYRISVPRHRLTFWTIVVRFADELPSDCRCARCFLEAVCRDPASGKHWD